jgi:cytochrome P450
MARILSDADVLLKVQAEISDALATSNGIFSLEMLQQLPYLGYCIKVSFASRICSCQFSTPVFIVSPIQESLRLHANGIQLRRVMKDVEIAGFNVPAGMSFHASLSRCASSESLIQGTIS